jgi:hypothetical protein
MTSHGQTQIHKTHHGPNLDETTTFPLIIFFVLGHGGCTQMSFCPKILEIGIFATLEAYEVNVFVDI